MIRAFAWVLTEVALGQKKTRARRGSSLGLLGKNTWRGGKKRRFKDRENHPLKQWKLSPIDRASLDMWADYTVAKEKMFFFTDTSDAPWIVVKSNCKKRARLNTLRYVLHKIPYDQKDFSLIGRIDPLLVGRSNIIYEKGETFLMNDNTPSATSTK